MMLDKDSKLIFEAYSQRLLNEAPPLELGGDSWGYSDDQRDTKRSFNLLSDDAVDRIVNHVMSLFPKDGGGNLLPLDIGEKHEARGKKSVSMWLRGQIEEFVKSDRLDAPEAYEGSPSTNVRYNARVIANDMLDDSHGQPFIAITERGAEVDVDQVEDVKGDIRADLANTPPTDVEDLSRKPAHGGETYKDNVEYTADAAAGSELDVREQEMLEYFQDGMTGAEFKETLANTIDFRQLAHDKPREFKQILNKFVQTGALVAAQATTGDEEIPDLGQVEDDRYAAQDYAAQHFGQTPGGLGGGSMGDY